MIELLTLLGFAFLGGLILNATPCVLPVLPLKILHFQHLAEKGAGARSLHGLLYSLGIIASFLALALIVLGIQYVGGFAYWGFQFQSPIFSGLMALIMGVLGAHMLGWTSYTRKGFSWLTSKLRLSAGQNSATSELKARMTRVPLVARLQARLQDWLQKVKISAPLAGSFAQGCLTTALGSACCGPFLGYAMGMALGAAWYVTLPAFLAAGIGMALPYIILTIFPKLLNWIPKSRGWVKTIKICGGIGMLLTAGWLALLAL